MMERLRLKTKSILKVFLLLFIISIPNNIYAEDVRIHLNDKKLNFNTEPIIVNGTTFVPMRKIFEELGAEVLWNEKERKVQGQKDDTLVEIDLKKDRISINSRIIPMEKSSILKNDTTLVPLRVISESFESEVLYEKKKEYSDINIYTNQKNSLGCFTNKDIKLNTNINKSELLESLGKPNRIDYYSDDTSLYIYNNYQDAYSDYIQVLVKDNKHIVKIETNSKNWSIDNRIKIGSSYNKDIIKQYNKILKDEGMYLKVSESYDKKVSFLSLESDKISKESWYKNNDKHLEEIIKSKEDQIFDYTNVIRVNNNLEPLDRDKRLNTLARNHSLDMSKNNFVSHTNLRGQKAIDRFKNERLNISFGGENLSAGYLNPSEVMNTLYNSKGHRNNILNKSEFLGIGAAYNKNSKYKIYFTQVYGRR